MFLDEMRALALDFLQRKIHFGGFQEQANRDPEAWYRNLRDQETAILLRYLLEPPGRIERIYVLKPMEGDAEALSLEAHDLTEEKARRVPFAKPSGSQSRWFGPVVKRSSQKGKGPGPKLKIVESSITGFREKAASGEPWAGYFREIVELLEQRPVLVLPDGTRIEPESRATETGAPALSTAIQIINEKKTVFLIVADHEGRWPGDRKEYTSYLQAKLSERYVTKNAPAEPQKDCSLCAAKDVTVYANGIKGAGINFSNMERTGAFPGVQPSDAWKRFAICSACADLITVYKNHVAKDYEAQVAGEKVLVVPRIDPPHSQRRTFSKRVQAWLALTKEGTKSKEEQLLRILRKHPGLVTLNFLWVKMGQHIEECRGVVSEVPPTRLMELSTRNLEANRWNSPVFPRQQVHDCQFDLSLQFLGSLLKRPGGNVATKVNNSSSLRNQRIALCQALYHKRPMDETAFYQEWHETACWYLLEFLRTDREQNGFSKSRWMSLFLESTEKQAGKGILTFASWMRHTARFLHYLRMEGVFPMINTFYEPKMEDLKPYFTAESGIDCPEKAFAFLLGVLFGYLMRVQGARKVNVAANALTWLRRLSLKGKDLPELYVKIRGKLLEYGSEKDSDLRELIEEIGRLGVRLGDSISLDHVKASYFLLLGQSLNREVLPKKEKKAEETP